MIGSERRHAGHHRGRWRGRQSPGVGVIFIDLDDFIAVNDTYGHLAGDEVLLAVTHRLLALVRPGGAFGRLGGDEFAVLVARANLAGVTKMADRSEISLAEPHFVQGHPVLVPGCVGVPPRRYLRHPGSCSHRPIEPCTTRNSLAGKSSDAPALVLGISDAAEAANRKIHPNR